MSFNSIQTNSQSSSYSKFPSTEQARSEKVFARNPCSNNKLMVLADDCLPREIKDLQREIERLDGKIKSARETGEELSYLEPKFKEVIRKIICLNEKIMQSKREEEQAQINNSLVKIQKKVQINRDSLADLEEQAQINNSLVKIQEQVQIISNSLANLERQITDFNKQIANLEGHEQTNSNDLVGLKGQMADLGRRLERQVTDLTERLERQVTDLQKQVESNSDGIANVQKEAFNCLLQRELDYIEPKFEQLTYDKVTLSNSMREQLLEELKQPCPFNPHLQVWNTHILGFIHPSCYRKNALGGLRVRVFTTSSWHSMNFDDWMDQACSQETYWFLMLKDGVQRIEQKSPVNFQKNLHENENYWFKILEKPVDGKRCWSRLPDGYDCPRMIEVLFRYLIFKPIQDAQVQYKQNEVEDNLPLMSVKDNLLCSLKGRQDLMSIVCYEKRYSKTAIFFDDLDHLNGSEFRDVRTSLLPVKRFPPGSSYYFSTRELRCRLNQPSADHPDKK